MVTNKSLDKNEKCNTLISYNVGIKGGVEKFHDKQRCVIAAVIK